MKRTLHWIWKVVDWVALSIVGLFFYFVMGFLSQGIGKFLIKLSEATQLPPKLHDSWEVGTYNKEIVAVYIVSFFLGVASLGATKFTQNNRNN